MSSDENHGKSPSWRVLVEKFEKIVVAVLALLLVVVIAVILGVVAYIFAIKVGATVISIDIIADVQQYALRAFSGVLLVLLGLELLDTVKVYFREHNIRVEVILLVGLIAMGRHVLEIDLHHINPLTLFGFSTLILALAISYFLVKRAPVSIIKFKGRGRDETDEGLTGK